MTDSQIPFSLKYNVTKPIGFPSYIRNTTFLPTFSYGQSITQNDMIRVELHSKGFLDPYSTFINIEVQVDPTEMEEYQILKLDQSAQSLFTEMRITSRGVTLEHLQEYDVLANILHDMNFNAQYRRTRKYEGHSDFVGFYRQAADNNNLQAVPLVKQIATIIGGNGTMNSTSLYSPLYVSGIPADAGNGNISIGNVGNLQVKTTTAGTHVNSYPVGSTNTSTIGSLYGQQMFGGFGYDAPTINATTQDELTHIRMALGTSNYALTATIGGSNIEQEFSNYLHRYEFNEQVNCDEAYEPSENICLDQNVRKLNGLNKYGNTGSIVNSQISYQGYLQPRNPHFADCATGEPFFAGSGLKLLQLVCGKPVRQNGRFYLSFSFPLISAIFGSLVPPDTYKYIPLAAFEDLVFEFKLNPYAFFNSGYKKLDTTKGFDHIVCQGSDFQVVQNEQMKKNWVVSKFEINADILSFDPRIESIIDNQLQSNDGIIIQTAMWSYGPSYTFQSTSQIQGTFGINMGFNSLKSLVFGFIPLDYMKYNFCRKLYRISHNLTKFQIVLGSDVFPQEGVKGHAGTVHPVVESKYQNNKNFLINLHKAFNKLHDMRGNILITPYNFALSDRPYNPAMTGPPFAFLKYSDALALQNSTTQHVGDKATKTLAANKVGLFAFNGSTAGGLPYFHETRCIGKALYGLDTETLQNDYSVLSGLNTTQFRPFNLYIECDTSQNTFQRDSRMFMFFYYDAVIQLKKNQAPIVSGRI